MKLRHCSLLLGMVLTLALPSLAQAEDPVRYREEIQAYKQRCTDLTNGAQGTQVSAEMQQAYTWLDEALVQVGKENYGAVKALLQRVKVELEWADAQTALLDKRAAANTKEEELLKARQDLSVAKAELEELTKQETELKAKLDTLKQGK